MKSALQFIFILLITFTAVRVDARVDACVDEMKIGINDEQLNELRKAVDMESSARNLSYVSFIFKKKYNDLWQSAFEIYSRLAIQGSADAQYRLSKIYKWGYSPFGTDWEMMAYYLKRAAAQNHFSAQFELGSRYAAAGYGFKYDPIEAYKWIYISYLNRILSYPLAQHSEMRRQLDRSYSNSEKNRGRNLAIMWMNRYGLANDRPCD